MPVADHIFKNILVALGFFGVLRCRIESGRVAGPAVRGQSCFGSLD